MGSVNIYCDTKRELDDSGCVQDDFANNVYSQVGILDLSDDVLLYILRHCSSRDLKALGYSCPRFGRLVMERSLWRYVDAREEPCSQARLKWLLDNTLHEDTQLLLLSGYAKITEGCLGLISVTRQEAAEENKLLSHRTDGSGPGDGHLSDQIHEIPLPVHLERHHARFFISAQRTTHMPRFRGFPSWSDDSDLGRIGSTSCNGPQFSLSSALLQQLSSNCPQLTTLSLEYCNINCNKTNLGHFPRTLRKLSLRGTKCFNMTIDKSFLIKIQDYLPNLESLDVSECEWMHPATLLPLSKLAALEELVMRDCIKMAEFVAYASLTSRYGFRTLKSLDLRGSPVGDSEVSALGWLPSLERLWLAASSITSRSIKHHAHYADDTHTEHNQLHTWEAQEPEYFKSRSNPEPTEEPSSGDVESDTTFMVYDDIYTPHRSHQKNKSKDRIKRKPEDGSGDSADINGEPPVPPVPPVFKRQRVDNSNNNDSDNICNETNGNETIVSNEIDTSDENDHNYSKNDKENNISEITIDECEKLDSDQKDTKESPQHDEASEVRGNGEGPGQSSGERGSKGEQNKEDSPDCLVDCIKIDQLIDVGEIRCGRQNEVIVIASTSRPRNQADENQQTEQEDRSEPEKNLKRSSDVNDGASTSKDPDTEEPKVKYVCFRKNQEPVYVNCPPENQRREPLPPIQYQIEPRHHVLYVSVGPQLNTYRFPRDSSEVDRHLNLNFRATHVDSSSLVTDFAIRRFGRADGEDVNIIHIGPNGPMVVGHDTGSRPDRSNLRFLSVTGFRNITDRSLVHLATAAPFLTTIDFSETSITESGAESFRSIRPDCELTYSKYTEKKEE